MSRERLHHRTTHNITLFFILLGTTLSTLPTAAESHFSELSSTKSEAAIVEAALDRLHVDGSEPSGCWRDSGLDPWRVGVLYLDVVRGGQLDLEVDATDVADGVEQGWPVILDVDCAAPADFNITWRGESRWQIDLEDAATCAVRIGSLDPSLGVEGYRLGYHLQPSDLLQPGDAVLADVAWTTDKDALDDGGESDEELEIEPDNKRLPSPGWTLQAEATWGCREDGDTLTLEVERAQYVAIATSGEADTAGILLDAEGRRLAWDDDRGIDRNFEIVRFLAAGTYSVRVESAHRETTVEVQGLDSTLLRKGRYEGRRE